MFERLKKEFDQRGRTSITITDVLHMPPLPRRVMIVLLRHSQPMSLVEIADAIGKDTKLLDAPPSEDELTAVIAQLVHRCWLVPLGEGKHVTYRAKLGCRKNDCEVTRNIWLLLEENIAS